MTSLKLKKDKKLFQVYIYVCICIDECIVVIVVHCAFNQQLVCIESKEQGYLSISNV